MVSSSVELSKFIDCFGSDVQDFSIDHMVVSLSAKLKTLWLQQAGRALSSTIF